MDSTAAPSSVVTIRVIRAHEGLEQEGAIAYGGAGGWVEELCEGDFHGKSSLTNVEV